MEQELQIQWPDWPAQKIQAWLEIKSLGTQVKYKYWKIGELPMVFLSTRKAMPGDEILPWPEYPIAQIQKHLHLDLATTVSYQYSQNRYAVVWVEKPKMDRDEFAKVVDQNFEVLINE